MVVHWRHQNRVNICTSINGARAGARAWTLRVFDFTFHTSGCIHLNGNPSSPTINVLIHGRQLPAKQCNAGSGGSPGPGGRYNRYWDQARPRPLVWGWAVTWDRPVPVSASRQQTSHQVSQRIHYLQQWIWVCRSRETEDDGCGLSWEAAPLPPGPAQHPCHQRGQGPRETEEEDRRQVSWARRDAGETGVGVIITWNRAILHCGKYVWIEWRGEE